MVRSVKPTPGSRKDLQTKQARDEEIEFLLRAAKDPVFWFANCVFTQDVHDKTIPAKPFPSFKAAPYIYRYIEVLASEDRVLVEKSRQLMWSWTTVAWFLWRAQFRKNEFVYFISQKQGKANKLISRAKFIYNHQPFSRAALDTIHTVTYSQRDIGTRSRIPFYPPRHEIKVKNLHHEQSVMEAFSEEADDIRMETASAVFFDEMAFMDAAEEACQAIMPTLGTTGQLVGVSTPNGPCYYYRLVFDMEEAEVA